MNWQTSIPSFLDPPATRSLILLSDMSDPYLLAELVQYGGFDVLSRPFEREEVLGTLAFAYKTLAGRLARIACTLGESAIAGRSRQVITPFRIA
jgi:hypothetical protein